MMPRRRDWENSLLDIVTLEMRGGYLARKTRLSLSSGELFSGICLASSEIPLCLYNAKVLLRTPTLGYFGLTSPATPHRNLS